MVILKISQYLKPEFISAEIKKNFGRKVNALTE